MATFLFDKIVFGPVRSRRLGVSLGINLLPADAKVCNFNCIYCECGWTHSALRPKGRLPSRKDVSEALESKLSGMKHGGEIPDVITYAGNGEPTMHPEFPGIIDDSIAIRNKYFPEARIAVLSNATSIMKPRIKDALLKVDQNILKLDSAFDQTIRLHNQPVLKISADDLIAGLEKFNGKLIIQTLFLRGEINGQSVDNTTEKEIEAWLGALRRIRPEEVMIYTISRDTPEGPLLRKVPVRELRQIAAWVEAEGIKTQVSG